MKKITVFLGAVSIFLAPALLAAQTPPYGQVVIANGGPVWASPGTLNYTYARTNINNYPAVSEFGAGTVPIVQGSVAGVNIPAGSTVFQAHALAGYTLNSSNTTNGVPVFGQLLSGANNAGGDAINGVCSNASTQAGTGSSQGYSVGNMACIESDINSMPLIAGGGASSSNMYGFMATGGSTIQPVGEFDGFYAKRNGNVPWKNGFRTNAGGAQIGVNLGPVAASGTSNSQSVQLNAVTAASAPISSSMTLDTSGNVVISSGSTTGSTLLTGSNGSLSLQADPNLVLFPGHMLSNGSAPAVSSCGTGASITGSDLAGTIVSGGGTATCSVAFAAAYGSPPHCVMSSRNHTAFGYTTSTTSLSLSSITGTEVFDYICVGLN